MKSNHQSVLKEITDELELSTVSGGSGSGDWATGAQTVWGAAVGGIASSMGYNCSFPAPVYGPDTSTPTGSGTCVPPGWNVSAGRYCNWDPSNDNDVCY